MFLILLQALAGAAFQPQLPPPPTAQQPQLELQIRARLLPTPQAPGTEARTCALLQQQQRHADVCERLQLLRALFLVTQAAEPFLPSSPPLASQRLQLLLLQSAACARRRRVAPRVVRSACLPREQHRAAERETRGGKQTESRERVQWLATLNGNSRVPAQVVTKIQ